MKSSSRLLLLLAPLTLLAASCAATGAAPDRARVRLATGDGVALERATVGKTARGVRVAGELADPGGFHDSRHEVWVTAVAADGKPLATGAARLRFVPRDRVPSARSRLAVFSAELPAVGSIDHFEVRLRAAAFR